MNGTNKPIAKLPLLNCKSKIKKIKINNVVDIFIKLNSYV